MKNTTTFKTTLAYYYITDPKGRRKHPQYLTEEWANEKRKQGYTVTKCNGRYVG